MCRRWAATLPEAYKEDVAARVAVGDLVRLEAMERGDGAAPDLDLLLYTPVGSPARQSRLKLFRRQPLGLSEVLPFFDHLGVEVVDQRPYHLRLDAARRLSGRPGEAVDHYVYDFGLHLPPVATAPGTTTDPARLARRFTDAFVAAWTGTSESDRFDRLVLQAGLTWRQVVVLRTYSRYLRQTGTTFSEEYIAGVLGANPEVARLLVAVFETRFAPDRFAQAEGAAPLAGPPRRGRARGRRGRTGPWRTSTTSPRTGSCARCSRRSSRRSGRASTPTAPTGGPGRRSRSSSTRSRSPTCPSPAPRTRSGCAGRTSRASTCASAPSPAAGCAGRTGWRTSAPRSSAWSRRSR